MLYYRILLLSTTLNMLLQLL